MMETIKNTQIPEPIPGQPTINPTTVPDAPRPVSPIPEAPNPNSIPDTPPKPSTPVPGVDNPDIPPQQPETPVTPPMGRIYVSSKF